MTGRVECERLLVAPKRASNGEHRVRKAFATRRGPRERKLDPRVILGIVDMEEHPLGLEQRHDIERADLEHVPPMSRSGAEVTSAMPRKSGKLRVEVTPFLCLLGAKPQRGHPVHGGLRPVPLQSQATREAFGEGRALHGPTNRTRGRGEVALALVKESRLEGE